jgi:hypothetical protein
MTTAIDHACLATSAADVLVPLEHLEARICQGAANLTAAEHAWLLAVAEFDRREGWARWECRSCAAWLAWQVGLDARAAREKVRVARALERFPLISAAMSRGELAYAKVRAITRIATEATEADLVDLALAATSNQVERIVAAYRRADPDAAAEREKEQHERRGLHHHVDDDGSVVISIRLASEPGLALLAAVDRLVPDDWSGEWAEHRADALVAAVEAAEVALTASTVAAAAAPRYLVVLHADPDGLVHEGGRREIDADIPGDLNPIGVSLPTARRIACDATVEVVETDATTADSAPRPPNRRERRARLVRGRLRRAVERRDGGCRFPGCTRRGRLDVHHIVHWIDGGSSEAGNLVCLCRHHHRVVHEGGWSIVGSPHGELRFVGIDGHELAARPVTTHGAAGVVDDLGRTADDIRCRWAGERLDLDAVMCSLFNPAIAS